MGCSHSKESYEGNEIHPQFECKLSSRELDDLERGQPEGLIKPLTHRTKIDVRVSAKYEIKALIGKGSFSDVLRVECKTSRQPYAIKIIHVQDAQARNLLDSEIEALNKTNHRFIIKQEEVIISKEVTYLVMELATGGELYDRIKSRGHLDEKQACNITQMLVEGIAYLHQVGITHRDLKPENLLFYHPGNNSKILITDLGFAKYKPTRTCDEQPLTTWCGTPEYISPEVLQKRAYNSKVDMWALGVIVYVMLSGHLPFSADTTPKLFHQIIAGKYRYTREVWNNVSTAAKDFIDRLLQVEPSERLEASAAFSHAWISAYEPLFKRQPKPKLNTRRSKTKLKTRASMTLKEELWSNQPYVRRTSIPLHHRDDESLQQSETTFINKPKKELILPFAGGRFAGSGIGLLTKEKILEDGVSSVTHSNIDSMLATEDTNSNPSNLGLLHEYFNKFQSTDDPALQEEIRTEYMSSLLRSSHNLTIPVQAPATFEPICIPPITFKTRQYQLSMHEQFADINEDSEDEAYLTIDSSKRVDVTKPEMAKSGSMVSEHSVRSHTIPIESMNSGYIEKVGVWLSGNEEKDSNQNNKWDGGSIAKPLDSLFDNKRSVSMRSNMTMSDMSSQNSTFSRFLLPKSSQTNVETLSTVSSQAPHSSGSFVSSVAPLLPRK